LIAPVGRELSASKLFQMPGFKTSSMLSTVLEILTGPAPAIAGLMISLPAFLAEAESSFNF